MEIKNFVKIYDNVLPLETLSNFIRFMNLKQQFNEAQIANNKTDFNIRRTYTYELTFYNTQLMSDIHWSRLLAKVFLQNILEYKKDMNIIDFPLNNLINITVLKYKESGFYTWHTDHYEKNPRTMSCIYLLNNDYEGGNLCFRNPDGSGEWDIDVKANTMIVWPSNFLYPHTVKPVTKGTRYSVVAWAI